MPKKTYTIADVKMGRIEIEECEIEEEGVTHPGLRLTCYYQFLEETGELAPNLMPSGITIEHKIADLPKVISDAVQALKTFLYGKAKEKEKL